jgi:hypothetical protein
MVRRDFVGAKLVEERESGIKNSVFGRRHGRNLN